MMALVLLAILRIAILLLVILLPDKALLCVLLLLRDDGLCNGLHRSGRRCILHRHSRCRGGRARRLLGSTRILDGADEPPEKAVHIPGAWLRRELVDHSRPSFGGLVQQHRHGGTLKPPTRYESLNLGYLRTGDIMHLADELCLDLLHLRLVRARARVSPHGAGLRTEVERRAHATGATAAMARNAQTISDRPYEAMEELVNVAGAGFGRKLLQHLVLDLWFELQEGHLGAGVKSPLHREAFWRGHATSTPATGRWAGAATPRLEP
mmetsp:Transcript_41906/g.115543  ORF Transcript_41906/g.115543 Transcript_41906/m.115543 type:complete len:266 (+) Transcript_41906:1157-1954(+)